MTPFGRYHFNRLPFGITWVPEHFQRRMSTLRDLEGVVCLIDDVLIYDKSQEQHDERLLAVLFRLEEAGLTLNRDKCGFSKRSEISWSHTFPGWSMLRPRQSSGYSEHGRANDCKKLRRFLGMVNQLSKFMLHLAEMTKPLRNLLSKKNEWMCGQSQKQTFSLVKDALTESPALALLILILILKLPYLAKAS